MTAAIIIQIILLGVGLSADAFAVSVTDGLTYRDLNGRRSVFIAATFGIMQGLMPLIGYWLVEAVAIIVNESQGASAGKIMALAVTWVAFALLILIGGKMLIDGVMDVRKPSEDKEVKFFSIKEVLLFGIATSIDALGTGVALHSGTLSDNVTIFLHVLIIAAITFSLSLVGVLLGDKIGALLKGKYEITEIIGGAILIALAVFIVLEHYLGF
ncbi:MAG: manganese efflux pump MntP family protein [Bacilli bacterium]|nr:manganese efflux pump MntP family protein [Bacilli bacterium]